MREHKLNYNQALAWNSQELRTWLLGREETHLLPIDLVRYVSSFVVPLTEIEVVDLAEKLKVASQKFKEALQNKAKFNFSEAEVKAGDNRELPEQNPKGKKPEGKLGVVKDSVEREEGKTDQSEENKESPKP